MSRLSDLRNQYADEIADVVQELAIMTPLKEAELRSFTADELAEIKTLIEAVDAATDENERKAAVLNNVSSATKLLSKLIGL